MKIRKAKKASKVSPNSFAASQYPKIFNYSSRKKDSLNESRTGRDNSRFWGF